MSQCVRLSSVDEISGSVDHVPIWIVMEWRVNSLFCILFFLFFISRENQENQNDQTMYFPLLKAGIGVLISQQALSSVRRNLLHCH